MQKKKDILPSLKDLDATELQHPIGRSINSDWFVNNFIMVFYEKMFFLLQSEFGVQRTTKKTFLIDNHYKSFY